MSITLLPRRPDDLDPADAARDGAARATDVSQPVAPSGGSSGPASLCASLDGDSLRETLKAFGRSDLAAAFYNDIPADRLFLLVCLLRIAARVIEQCDASDRKALREGQPASGIFHPALHRYTPWPDLPVEASVASIREASDWLDELRRLGCGVRVQRRRRS